MSGYQQLFSRTLQLFTSEANEFKVTLSQFQRNSRIFETRNWFFWILMNTVKFQSSFFTSIKITRVLNLSFEINFLSQNKRGLLSFFSSLFFMQCMYDYEPTRECWSSQKKIWTFLKLESVCLDWSKILWWKIDSSFNSMIINLEFEN